MNRNKLILLCAAILTLAAVLVTVGIAVGRPTQSEGGYYRDVIDRLDIGVEHTEFRLAADPDGEYEVSFRLSLKKAEADFYALLHSVQIEGVQVKTLTFCNVTGNAEFMPRDLLLPAENGVAKEIAWDVTLTFTAAEAGELPFSLTLDYTSGMTRDTADEHILEIPMKAVIDQGLTMNDEQMRKAAP